MGQRRVDGHQQVEAWLAANGGRGWGNLETIAWLAALAHHGQKRKYTEEPYIVHPLEVADLIDRTIPVCSWRMVATALLHDTLEDTLLPQELIGSIDPHLLEMVLAVTDVSTPADGNRAARKQKDLEHIATASPDAKAVKLADLISNSRSIVARDAEFAKVYMQEKRALLDVLKDSSSHELYEMARDIVDNYFAVST